ncbi:MAG: B12-binding domain-containing radical SAM protein [Deltaproteobacteria bacterium]|nr:B12-binding domain-containing radical SAM protein [Deltaproteobacteria bacterium]
MKLLFIQDTIDSESIGVSYISSVLRSAGHTTDLFIASLEKNLFDKIRTFSPDAILFSVVITKQDYYDKLGNELKKDFPKVKIIAGGPYITLNNSFALREWLDFALIGEAEEAVVELIHALADGGDLRDIKNLVYKEEGRLIINELRNLNEDLDSLPFPDRGLYLKYPSFKNLTVKRFLSGRGCPYACTFCFTRKLRDIYRGKGRYIRKHSAERICEEINLMKRESVLRTVHFSDDLFLTDKKWLNEFYNIYPKKVGIPFQCNLTANVIDEDIIRLLKECGLRGVGIGLESGVEEIRRKVLGKVFSNEEILEVARLLHKYKIEIYTYNMIALPHEKIDDALMTLELNRRMNAKITQCNIAIPFEGLPLTEMAIKSSLLNDFSLTIHMNKRPESPMIRVEFPEKFERLFLLFPFLSRFHVGFSVVKLLLKLPLNFLYRFLHRLTYFINMKEYYDISFLSGLMIFLDIKKGERYLKRFFKK